MQVKDVICEALRLVGRDDAADAISGNSTLTDEVSRLKRACLTYLNAVLDELARGYFPLVTSEEIYAFKGLIPFENFAFKPIEIKRVTANDKDVKWYIYLDDLHVATEDVTVYYSYTPNALAEDDEFFYPDFAVSERLVEYGIAAEFLLVLGDASGSAAWENKYRNEIENLLSQSTVKGRIPPRRWI